MKAISLTQPFASLVVCGAKAIETRSWRTLYRGRILIHAAKGYPDWARQLMLANPKFHAALREYMGGLGSLILPLPLGAIIGSVELVDILRIEAHSPWYVEPGQVMPGLMLAPPEPELSFGDYTPGRNGWILRDPVRFLEPIPYRGSLSVFEVPDDIVKGAVPVG